MNQISLLIQLFLLAVFLSINNFAAALGMGFSRIWAQMRWRIAVIFGFFDFLAPLAGLFIGNFVVGMLGKVIGFIGVLVIFLLGAYLVYDGWIKHSSEESQNQSSVHHGFLDKAVASTWAIMVIGFGVSFDNLIVGFGLGTFQIPIVVAAAVFGIVTFFAAFLGLFIGTKTRVATEEKIMHFAGKGRIITGTVFVVIALWKFSEIL